MGSTPHKPHKALIEKRKAKSVKRPSAAEQGAGGRLPFYPISVAQPRACCHRTSEASALLCKTPDSGCSFSWVQLQGCRLLFVFSSVIRLQNFAACPLKKARYCQIAFLILSRTILFGERRPGPPFRFRRVVIGERWPIKWAGNTSPSQPDGPTRPDGHGERLDQTSFLLTPYSGLGMYHMPMTDPRPLRVRDVSAVCHVRAVCQCARTITKVKFSRKQAQTRSEQTPCSDYAGCPCTTGISVCPLRRLSHTVHQRCRHPC